MHVWVCSVWGEGLGVSVFWGLGDLGCMFGALSMKGV